MQKFRISFSFKEKQIIRVSSLDIRPPTLIKKHQTEYTRIHPYPQSPVTRDRPVMKNSLQGFNDGVN
jgi:hypothetical protein